MVWRRLLVVNETSLGKLHEILQHAFDWSGEHLHRFFAFALLPFETAAKRPKFYSCAFVSIVYWAEADRGMRCPGVIVKPHDSISSEPRSDVARSPTSKPRR